MSNNNSPEDIATQVESLRYVASVFNPTSAVQSNCTKAADTIESQAAKIAELEREIELVKCRHSDLAVELFSKQPQPETKACPECSQYNVRYSVVMKDLQQLASKICGGDCSHSHGLDCTTIIARHWDKLKASPPPTGWQPIETAPKGVKVLGAYRNKLGNWRRVMMRYYGYQQLETDDDSFEDDEGFAPEGWYEECESQENIRSTDEPPLLWHPLPAQPSGEPDKTQVKERWISMGSLNNGKCCFARASDFAACCLPNGHDCEHRSDHETGDDQ